MTNTIQKTTQPMEMPSFAGYEKRTYTVDEIQDILNISRTTAYELVKMDNFKVIRVGRTIRISKRSFDEWLDNQI
ncbi:MAG: DNA-binding protein [Clostridia bacterium]|nr:DNA-binding protein [Clostridia bacterium]